MDYGQTGKNRMDGGESFSTDKERYRSRVAGVVDHHAVQRRCRGFADVTGLAAIIPACSLKHDVAGKVLQEWFASNAAAALDNTSRSADTLTTKPRSSIRRCFRDRGRLACPSIVAWKNVQLLE
jgi:hypothetical protein